jgi:hypothetical protein
VADSFDIDFPELNRLAADLGEVPEKAGPFIRKAVEVTARNVRDDWRANARGLRHAPAFPYSITYDIGAGYDQSIVQAVSSVISGAISSARSTTITAEIGPDKARAQGALGNLIEFGSVHNSPQGLGHAALQRNEGDLQKGLEIALKDAERAAGL